MEFAGDPRNRLRWALGSGASPPDVDRFLRRLRGDAGFRPFTRDDFDRLRREFLAAERAHLPNPSEVCASEVCAGHGSETRVSRAEPATRPARAPRAGDRQHPQGLEGLCCHL